jgi:hypothetical protein
MDDALWCMLADKPQGIKDWNNVCFFSFQGAECAFSLLYLSVTCVLAKSTDGHATVVLNDQTFNPAAGDETKLDKQMTPVTGPILFCGIHVNFDINVTDLSIRN